MSDDSKKKYHDLDISDVTKYDMTAIREMARDLFLNKRDKIATPDCIVEAVFTYIHSKGMRITRDESRQDTWSVPNSSWYSPYKKIKTDW